MNFSFLPGKTGLFLGIGGSGMSSLAHILLDMGYSIQGYDKKETDITCYLKERGSIIVTSLSEIKADQVDFIVFSSAINDKNHGIYLEVSDFNLPMFHRSEVLHKIFSLSKSASVAGSHGKTTTTAMLAQILELKKMDPTVMIGGDTKVLGKKGGKFGTGLWGVYESDESDGTFLNHRAQIRVVTNIDNDHLDYYKTADNLENSFRHYIASDKEGHAVLQGQDIGIQRVLTRMIYFENFASDFQLWLLIDRSSIRLEFWNKMIDRLIELMGKQFHSIFFSINNDILEFTFNGQDSKLKLPFTGRHYLMNGLSALVCAHIVGVDQTKSIEILTSYAGVTRRQEVLGVKNDVTVIDDYGHHPTEIKTVIRSLIESKMGKGKLVVIFQPHRYTRTSILHKEFAESLEESEYLFLLPIYSAGEKEMKGVSTSIIIGHLATPNYQLLSGNISEDQVMIRKRLFPGDTLLCLGAGDVRDWGNYFLKFD